MNLHHSALSLALVIVIVLIAPTSALAQPQTLEALMEQLEPCPAFEQVLSQAIRAQGYQDQGELMGRRARLSNLLPRVELELGADRDTQRQDRYREDFNRGVDYPFMRDFMRQDVDERSASGQSIKVKLRFELGKLIYDPQELATRRLFAQERKARGQLIELVAQLYWRRRHHQLERLLLPVDDLEGRLHHTIEIELMGAQLNGLTRGWFYQAHQTQAPTRRR